MAPILDSHVHFWDTGRFDYPWLTADPLLGKVFLPADLDAATAAVDGLLVIQAECRPDQSAAEVAWLTGLARHGAPIQGVVAYAPLERGRGCTPHLAALAEQALVVGVRRLVQDEPAGFAVRGDFVDGVRLLAQHGLVMDLCARDHQLPEVTRLVEGCPEVSFVLDHLGKPGVAARVRHPWAQNLSRLAARPNVSCKLSGLTSEAGSDTGTPEQLRPYLHHAVDSFGPERCMFGSDWPVASTSISYQGWVDVVRDAIGDLTDAEGLQIMHGTALAVYRRARTRPREPSC